MKHKQLSTSALCGSIAAKLGYLPIILELEKHLIFTADFAHLQNSWRMQEENNWNFSSTLWKDRATSTIYSVKIWALYLLLLWSYSKTTQGLLSLKWTVHIIKIHFFIEKWPFLWEWKVFRCSRPCGPPSQKLIVIPHISSGASFSVWTTICWFS